MRGLSAQSEGEDRGQAVSGRPRLLSGRTDQAGWLCACRVLGGGPAGLGLTAEERCLSGRLCALDGGHVSRWVLAVPCTAVPLQQSLLTPLCDRVSSQRRETVGPSGEAHSRITTGAESLGTPSLGRAGAAVERVPGRWQSGRWE